MTIGRQLIVLGFVVGVGVSILGAVEAREGGKDWGKILQRVQLSLADAIQTAESETGGRAIGAGMEMEGGKIIMEVWVFKGGASPRLLEVEIDGETGEVLEVEYEDSDSDSESDEDSDTESDTDEDDDSDSDSDERGDDG